MFLYFYSTPSVDRVDHKSDHLGMVSFLKCYNHKKDGIHPILTFIFACQWYKPTNIRAVLLFAMVFSFLSYKCQSKMVPGDINPVQSKIHVL